MVDLAEGEKMENILLVSTHHTNVSDRRTVRQTDGRTAHDGIGKNRYYCCNVDSFPSLPTLSSNIERSSIYRTQLISSLSLLYANQYYAASSRPW